MKKKILSRMMEGGGGPTNNGGVKKFSCHLPPYPFKCNSPNAMSVNLWPMNQ